MKSLLDVICLWESEKQANTFGWPVARVQVPARPILSFEVVQAIDTNFDNNRASTCLLSWSELRNLLQFHWLRPFSALCERMRALTKRTRSIPPLHWGEKVWKKELSFDLEASIDVSDWLYSIFCLVYTDYRAFRSSPVHGLSLQPRLPHIRRMRIERLKTNCYQLIKLWTCYCQT